MGIGWMSRTSRFWLTDVVGLIAPPLRRRNRAWRREPCSQSNSIAPTTGWLYSSGSTVAFGLNQSFGVGQEFADRLQKGGGRRPVNDAVIEGQAQGHHLLPQKVGVAAGDSLDDSSGTQNSGFGWIDDRRER